MSRLLDLVAAWQDSQREVAPASRSASTIDDRWAAGIPAGPCMLCGRPMTWVEDWPTAGENRWLCPTCAAWPPLALAEVFAGLTAEERTRFEAEVASGEHLSVAVFRELRGGRRAAS